jgi:hypothetical protein
MPVVLFKRPILLCLAGQKVIMMLVVTVFFDIRLNNNLNQTKVIRQIISNFATQSKPK